MNWIKLAGHILILLAGGGFGIYFKSRLLNRRRILTAMMLAAGEASAYIGYTGADVKSLIAELDRRPGLEPLEFLGGMRERLIGGMPPYEAAREAAGSWQRGVLTDADRELIVSFLGGLGQSDRSGQLAHCALYQERLRVAAAEAAEAQRQRGKMTLSLSLLGALALVIVTI